MMPEPIEPIPEPTIWSFMIQISNAMKAVHDRGLAFRVIDATKVLLTGTSRSERLLNCCPIMLTFVGRLRINCCGMADLVNPDIHEVAAHQV